MGGSRSGGGGESGVEMNQGVAVGHKWRGVRG